MDCTVVEWGGVMYSTFILYLCTEEFNAVLIMVVMTMEGLPTKRGQT